MAASDAIILCGGQGSRLGAVLGGLPKPLACVGGRPFLDHLLAALTASGVVRQAVLALGFGAERFVEHYRLSPPPLPLAYAREATPLGTGGALVNALPLTESEPVLAANGDSLFCFDLRALLRRHLETRAEATLALVEASDAGRFGSVELAGTRVTAFREKAAAHGPGLIYGGIALVARKLLMRPLAPLSLERELLPDAIARGSVSALAFASPFVDIGLPETLAGAAAILQALQQAPAAVAVRDGA